MAYRSVGQMAANQSLLNRIIGCAAMEYIPNPDTWASHYIWHFCSQPGWTEAWEYAINARGITSADPDYAKKMEELGNDGGVITDAMILSACQAIRATPPERTSV